MGGPGFGLSPSVQFVISLAPNSRPWHHTARWRHFKHRESPMNRNESSDTQGDPVEIRRGGKADLEGIVEVFRASRSERMRHLALRSPKSDREYFGRLFDEHSVMVAEEGGIVGFCVFGAGWIEHLYVMPGFQGRGIGSMLLERLKELNSELQLWTFQRNVEGRRFYESKGFKVVEETDGINNEEGEPDVRYVWRKPGSG
jgi:putative acetyltransferase